MSRSDTLTKYELAKVLGVRAEMLARGAPALVTMTDSMKRHGVYSVALIARAEYEQGVLPFVVSRSGADGKVTELRLSRVNPGRA